MRPPRLTTLALSCAALGVASATAAAQTPAVEPAEVVVQFRSDHAAVQQRVAERNDADVTRRLTDDGIAAVDVEPGESADVVADRLSDDPAVLQAVPDRPVRLSLTPNDPLFGIQWSLPKIRAPQAWDTTTGSAAVRVAVVDTAVDTGHPDLAPNSPGVLNPGEAGAGRETNGVDDDGNGYVDDVRGWDFYGDDPSGFGPEDNNPSPVTNDHWHGTHVASLIAARGNDDVGVSGVAWRAEVMPLRVLGPYGSGWFSDVVAAFAYAGQNGAHIVNASLGGAGDPDLNGPYTSMMRATFDANPQTLYVFAAGNAAWDNDGPWPELPCAVPSDNVICVAATDQNDNLAGFSSYGLTSVDLGAPGVGVHGAVLGGGHGSYSGTSFSSPNTAGVAALVLAADPTASTAQLKGAILGGAVPVVSLDGRTVTGARLDAAGALGSVPPGTPRPPSQPSSTPGPGAPPARPDAPAADPLSGRDGDGAVQRAAARVVRAGRGWELRLTLHEPTQVGAVVKRRVLRTRTGAGSAAFRFRTVRAVPRRALAAGRHALSLGRLRPGVHRVQVQLAGATRQARLRRTVAVAAPLRPIMQLRRRGRAVLVLVDVPSRGRLQAVLERRASRRGKARWVTVRSVAGKHRSAGLRTLRLRAPRAGGRHRVRVVVWEDFRRTVLTKRLR